MEYEAIEGLRDRHSAWRLLRAGNASLILSFLGRFFVDANRGACSAAEVGSVLDEVLYGLNTDRENPRYPKDAGAYLEDWAGAEAGYLRRFYPVGSDEIHYEVTPAFEKAYAWVESLRVRAFIGTESRLHTAVELLRQIVHGSETDEDQRIKELERRRDEIEAEIAAVKGGRIEVMDDTGIRDRYQQFASTARDLLSDFREVEDNFRSLDRAAREKIAAWDGSKGALLDELVGSRSDINGSDQGRSFQAFYDFLLSSSRQVELADLLAKVNALAAVEADRRVRTVHHDWSEAADRAQHTVRQISEQLRRFLDDQVWVENRRVLDLVRAIETVALKLRGNPPTDGLELDDPGVPIVLPFERPLYEPPPSAEVESVLLDAVDEELDADLLFNQPFVDAARLAENVRGLLPPRSSSLLEDIIDFYPLEYGAAEVVGYLALADEDLTVAMDESEYTIITYSDPANPSVARRLRMPKVTVSRR